MFHLSKVKQRQKPLPNWIHLRASKQDTHKKRPLCKYPSPSEYGLQGLFCGFSWGFFVLHHSAEPSSKGECLLLLFVLFLSLLALMSLKTDGFLNNSVTQWPDAAPAAANATVSHKNHFSGHSHWSFPPTCIPKWTICSTATFMCLPQTWPSPNQQLTSKGN